MSAEPFSLTAGGESKAPAKKRVPAPRAPAPVAAPTSAPSTSVATPEPARPRSEPHLHGTSGGPRFEVRERHDGTRTAVQLTAGLRAPWISREAHAAFVPLEFALPSRDEEARQEALGVEWYRAGIDAREAPYEPNEYRRAELEAEHAEWTKMREDRERTRIEAMNRRDAKLVELDARPIAPERYAPVDQLGSVSARVAAHEPEARVA